jgi:hypothetical protein
MVDSPKIHMGTMAALITEDMVGQEETNRSGMEVQVLVEEVADFPIEDLEVLEEAHHMEVGTHLDPMEDLEALEAIRHPEVETHLEVRTVVPADTSHRVTLEVEVDLHQVVDSQVLLE